LADRGGAAPAWRRGKRWFDVPQRAWLRRSLAPQVDQWRRDPHPLWAEVVDLAAMRRFADEWWRRSRCGPALDDQVFQAVALDRFLRTWFDH
jgi:hypothetical protein